MKINFISFCIITSFLLFSCTIDEVKRWDIFNVTWNEKSTYRTSPYLVNNYTVSFFDGKIQSNYR